MNKQDLITTRNANANDKNFIFSTWLRGLRYGNDFFGMIDKDVYYKVYQTVLESLLTSGAEITVACLKDDTDVILGYAVYKGTRLDWVFVKKIWRNIGIAKMLIPANVVSVTHITQIGKSYLGKHPEVIFNPFSF